MICVSIFYNKPQIAQTLIFILIYFKIVLFCKVTILIKNVYVYRYIYICWQTTWLLVYNYLTVINIKYLYV